MMASCAGGPAVDTRCGGVTALVYDEELIISLYVVCEAACTGVDGSNRFASN